MNSELLNMIVRVKEPYDTIIFRQDLLHQGVGYKNENYRLFCYIDVKAIKREDNGTYANYTQKVKSTFYSNHNNIHDFTKTRKRTQIFFLLFYFRIK